MHQRHRRGCGMSVPKNEMVFFSITRVEHMRREDGTACSALLDSSGVLGGFIDEAGDTHSHNRQ